MSSENIFELSKKILMCQNETNGKHYIKSGIMLPCGYKACLVCVKFMFEDNISFVCCPLCKSEHVFREGSNFDKLFNKDFEKYGNFMISDLLDKIESLLQSIINLI
jgi:hypothetical protein